MTPPLLRLSRARIERAGAPWVDDLDGEGGEHRLVLVGHTRPLLALLAGQARLAGGTVEIAGEPARSAVVQGRVGLALAEADVPREWTVRDYLSQSAELWGLTPREARAAADASLGQLGLEVIARRPLGLLDSASRRAAWIAHAILGGPATIVVEEPLGGLIAEGADHVRATLERAAADRRLIVAMEHHDPTAPSGQLAATADAAMVLTMDGVVFSGAPADAFGPDRRYLVTALQNGDALVRALEARDLRVRRVGPSTAAVTRLIVTLGSHDTRPIVASALDVDAPLSEVVPLAAADDAPEP